MLRFDEPLRIKRDATRLIYIEKQCIRLLRMEISKDLVAASATPLILAILAEGDSYGYAVIKRVAELSRGKLHWTDGMLYPVLHRLERQGLVAAKWGMSESGRRRKYYRITRTGPSAARSSEGAMASCGQDAARCLDEGEYRMTIAADRAPLEQQITHWREFLRRRPAIHASDVEELEDHLRGQVAMLTTAGLQDDEAFLIAVKRMGSLDALSHEFAREHSERLWKQLVITPDASDEAARAKNIETLVVLGLTVAAALAIKVPVLFGLQLDGGDEAFYARNASLFVLPLLTGYFAWTRGLDLVTYSVAVHWPLRSQPSSPIFFLSGLTVILEVLTVLHLPIALWLVVGVAYVGGRLVRQRPNAWTSCDSLASCSSTTCS